MRKAVCPGSFDPVTNGHLDIIRRGARVFDKVVVAVVNASVRKSQPLFNADERVELIEESIKDLPNVEVAKFDVLIVDFARDVRQQRDRQHETERRRRLARILAQRN